MFRFLSSMNWRMLVQTQTIVTCRFNSQPYWWLFDLVVTRWSLPGTVSIGMGDHSWVYHFDVKPSHLGLLSLAISPWVGAMSTGDAVMCKILFSK